MTGRCMDPCYESRWTSKSPPEARFLASVFYHHLVILSLDLFVHHARSDVSATSTSSNPLNRMTS